MIVSENKKNLLMKY